MESMKKSHDEIMFLYSMLNDKQTELTSLSGNLQRLAADIRNLQESTLQKRETKAGTKTNAGIAKDMSQDPKKAVQMTEQTQVSDAQAAKTAEAEGRTKVPAPEKKAKEKALENETESVKIKESLSNHNDEILALDRAGKSKVEIAKQLGLGLGEVTLVLGLYKGDENH